MDKVLIVEDSLETQIVLKRVLERDGYQIITTTNGIEAIELVAQEEPMLLLLDINIEGLSGYEVCKFIRSDPKYNPIHLIFLTAVEDRRSIVQALDIGGDDYLTKPFDIQELQARVRKGMRNARDKLYAIKDSQTSWYNKHFLDIYKQEHIFKLISENIPVSIILADIDHFKKINDTYGHDLGDIILTEFTNLLKKNIRNSDVPIRWGGEEFLIFCINSNLNDTVSIAERMRKKVEEHIFHNNIHLTASFGVTAYRNCRYDFFKEVDKALYRAKHFGRNQVVSSP